MIYSNRVDNFYLTPEQLAASPSRVDGVDEATERELRHYCCDVVAEAAVLLRLPQVVAATAQVLVQRFYCKRSLKKFDVKSVALAAFWLACKLEEVIEVDNPARLTLRNVIIVVDRVVRRRDGRSLAIMDPYSQKYEEMKQQGVKAERHMLRAFGFVLHVEHPHHFVLNYCIMLGCSKELQQRAWNMANDSLRSTLCVRYRAEVVACGIVFTAARLARVPLPESPPWWHLYEVGEAELADVCATLCQLYHQPRARHAPLAVAPPGAAPPSAVARSPLSVQTTPLRSPASGAPSTVGSLAALPVASAQPPRSEGEAPSIAQQAGDGDGQQQAASVGGGEAAAPAGEPSTANGGAAAPASDEPPADSGRAGGDSRRSRSPSSSRKRSRSRDRRRGDSRSRSRERKRSRSRSRGRDRGGKRDRRDDRPLYRPGGGRPPRRDDRRREGTHRPGAHAAPHARAAAAAS